MPYIPWWQRLSPPTFAERFNLGGLAGRVGFKDGTDTFTSHKLRKYLSSLKKGSSVDIAKVAKKYKIDTSFAYKILREFPELKTDRPAHITKGKILVDVTKKDQEIAKLLYGKKFEDLNVEKRAQIKAGHLTKDSMTSYRRAKELVPFWNKKAQLTYGKNFDQLPPGQQQLIREDRVLRTVEGGSGTAIKFRNKAEKFYKEFVKKNKTIPLLNDYTKAGLNFNAVKKLAAEEGVIKYEIPAKAGTEEFKKFKQKKINNELIKLSKNAKIMETIKKGDLPKLTDIKKILGITQDSIATNRVRQLLFSLTGERPVEGIKSMKKAKEALSKIEEYNVQARLIADKKVASAVGEMSSISSPKQLIRKTVDLAGYEIDELGGVKSSYRRGTAPYGVFSQIIQTELNQGVKRTYDTIKSKQEQKVIDALATKNKKKIKIAIDNFNNSAAKYEEILNKNTKKGQPKIKLLRITLDAPQTSIANFDKLPKSYKAAFINNFKTQGYSFKVPKDIKTVFETAKLVKNSKIQNKILSLAKLNAPRIFSKFALAEGTILDDVLKKQAEGKSALESFASPLFLDKAVHKGLKRWKADDLQNLAYDRANLLRLVEEGKVGMSSIASMAMQDSDFKGQPGEYIEWLKAVVADPHQQKLIRERDIETEEALTLPPERVAERKKRYETWSNIPIVRAIKDHFKSDEQKAQDLENLLNV